MAGYDINIGALGRFGISVVLTFGGKAVASDKVEFILGPVPARSDGVLVGATGVSEAFGGAPPVNIPTEHVRSFSMEGRAKFIHTYFDDKSDQKEKTYPEYSKEQVEAFVERTLAREEYYYGWTDTFMYAALDAHPVQGRTVLLIGSNVPW